VSSAGPPRRRPVPVTYVGALGLVAGVYHIVSGVLIVVDGGSTSKIAEGALDIALGLAVLVIAFGALRIRRWAWAAFMTWAVVGLTHQLLRHFFYEDVNYVSMALEAVSVLALTPLDVQVAFGLRPTREELDG
jgi:hypothetical protein